MAPTSALPIGAARVVSEMQPLLVDPALSGSGLYNAVLAILAPPNIDESERYDEEILDLPVVGYVVMYALLLSNVVVQLWEHWMDWDFRSVPKVTAAHYAKRYGHIPSARVLYVASRAGKLELLAPDVIRISHGMFEYFKTMSEEKELEKINRVFKALPKRRRKRDQNDEDD